MMEAAEGRAALQVNAVVYGTDFTVCSQNAGLYAALMARFFSAKLLVAHAFTLSQAAMEVEIDGMLVSQQRRDLQVLLAQKAATLASDSMEAIPLLVDGDPKEVLCKLADEHAPSLLVLGTHGGDWVEREIIGSVAEQVLRSSQWPTMTVGPQVRSASSRPFPFHRILYATDLSASAAKAAAFAASLAQAMGGEMDVLHVIEHGVVERHERLEEINRGFRDALGNEVKDFLGPQTFMEAGNAHEQILQHCRDRSIDLLVLGISKGIRKSSHLGLTTRTSGAFQLIVDAECPVLTVTG
jgi:nucleotide-binding universal stress UspA family protein